MGSLHFAFGHKWGEGVKGFHNKIILLLYIIKVGLRHRGCAKWLHQIAEILINF